MPEKTDLKCPECGSSNIGKASWSIRNRQKVQRYLCRECLRKFTEPPKET